MDVDQARGLAADVLVALTGITDPEIGGNIVDLGLIYDVSVDEAGAANVVMTTTTKGCPAAGFLQQAVRASVEAVAGVTVAVVQLTYEPRWTPEMIRPGVFPFSSRH
ncbi:metal-sulfur cluster assembly factor [Rhizobium sp. CAU 1783]